MRNTTGVYEFEVLDNEQVAQDVWRMRCRTKLASLLQPGQFVNVKVPNDASHILRIPLSFSFVDGDSMVLELVYAMVGEGTQRLTRMQRGACSTMVGPCGNGWSLPDAAGRALLVAGGVGLPPIAACARMLCEANVGFDLVVGGQTSSRHVDYLLDELRSMPLSQGCDCARSVIVMTDDGSRGIRGLPTTAMLDLLAEHSYVCCYTCGPQIMMANVARVAASNGVSCQVSLERMMGCGFGACSCCNVELTDGSMALCCKDGPVFDAREVVW